MKTETTHNTSKYLTAMISFGTISIFVRNISLSSKEIAFWRGAIALIVLLLFIIVTKKHTSFSIIRPQLLKLFLSGAAMGLNWILLFEAYNYTTVAIATLCYYFAPVLVLVFSALLFKEKLTKRQFVCFLAATLGLVLMIGIPGSGTGSATGIFMGLGAAVFYATVILLNKSVQNIDGLTRTFFQFLAAVIVLLPYILLTGGFHIYHVNTKGLINLLIIGIVHSGIMYVLYFSSLAGLPGRQAALLSYFDPLTAIIISILFLQEPITLLQLAGGFVILSATLISERKQNLP